jgi:hypothetical protein
LRRLALALANLSRLTDEGQANGQRSAVTDAARVRFAGWLANLRDQTESGTVSRAPLRMMVAKTVVPAFESIARSEDIDAPSSLETIVFERKILSLTQTLERQLTTISPNR